MQFDVVGHSCVFGSGWSLKQGGVRQFSQQYSSVATQGGRGGNGPIITGLSDSAVVHGADMPSGQVTVRSVFSCVTPKAYVYGIPSWSMNIHDPGGMSLQSWFGDGSVVETAAFDRTIPSMVLAVEKSAPCK